MPSTADVFQAASLALTRSLDLETVLETLLDYLAELVPYDSANVMLAEDAARLSVRAIRGYGDWADPAQVRSIRFDARANPIVDALFRERQTLVVPDTRHYPGWQRPPGTEHVLCWMGVPLSAHGQVIGLYSPHKAEPRFFTPEHRRLAESLAPHEPVAEDAAASPTAPGGRERCS
jgi:GAF domain-containing protein